MSDFLSWKVREELTPWMMSVTIGAAMVQLALWSFDSDGSATAAAVVTLVIMVLAFVPIAIVQQLTVAFVDVLAAVVPTLTEISPDLLTEVPHPLSIHP